MSPEKLISGEFIRAHGAPLAIVIAKVSTADLGRYQELFQDLLRWLSSQPPQTPLFADFSDDYSAMAGPLNNPFLEEYQRELSRVCALTVPCAALAERLRRWTKNAIHVIEDPWERPEQTAPRFAPGATFKLCWFGNFGELLVENVEMGLVQALDRLKGRTAQLDFVTAGSHDNLAVSLGRRVAQRFPALTFRFIPWSLKAQWQAIDDCDAVLLPQDYRSDWGSVKSHNRMVETLRSGRLPIASPIPSYRELSGHAWVGEHLGDGVEWALAHPQDVLARITSGQRYLQERFSPAAIGRKWAALLGVVACEDEARHGG
jgi:glycosyltransferase involved in cell wall biosynthesis